VGSSPTAVNARARVPDQPPCFRRRRATERACPRRPARASRPRGIEASHHRGDESAACPQKRPPWGSNPRPRPRGRGPKLRSVHLAATSPFVNCRPKTMGGKCGLPDRSRSGKAPRGFEPRSLDSESRVLTVTPRSQLSPFGATGPCQACLGRHNEIQDPGAEYPSPLHYSGL
jgi:hypothetical protein